MSRHSRGVTLIAARSWALIFSFAFIISFFASHNSSALAIDPRLDDVLSLVRRNQSDNAQKSDSDTTIKDKNGKASDSASANPSQQTDPQVPGDGSAASETPIVAEPLKELPTIDTSETLAQPIRSTQPARVATTSNAVLGAINTASVAPVQATSQGWKFFGVAWFWWLIVGVAGYYTTRRFARPYLGKILRQKRIVS